MDQIAITIAIPFYGQQEYLLAAVESVRAQSTPDWQLIVCDNASPDMDVARMSTAWSDPRIRYLRNAVNVGMAGNFNQCLEVAQTDLVTLLHHDDGFFRITANPYCRQRSSIPGRWVSFARQKSSIPATKHAFRCLIWPNVCWAREAAIRSWCCRVSRP